MRELRKDIAGGGGDGTHCCRGTCYATLHISWRTWERHEQVLQDKEQTNPVAALHLCRCDSGRELGSSISLFWLPHSSCRLPSMWHFPCLFGREFLLKILFYSLFHLSIPRLAEKWQPSAHSSCLPGPALGFWGPRAKLQLEAL